MTPAPPATIWVSVDRLVARNSPSRAREHIVGKPVYGQKPARLRMNRLGKAATGKADLDLFSLAVSAISNCEVCVQAHEKAVLDGGLTEDHVHDAVRLAAVIHAAAVALETAVVAPASGV